MVEHRRSKLLQGEFECNEALLDKRVMQKAVKCIPPLWTYWLDDDDDNETENEVNNGLAHLRENQSFSDTSNHSSPTFPCALIFSFHARVPDPCLGKYGAVGR